MLYSAAAGWLVIQQCLYLLCLSSCWVSFCRLCSHCWLLAPCEDAQHECTTADQNCAANGQGVGNLMEEEVPAQKTPHH